jgi:hypothetical protein
MRIKSLNARITIMFLQILIPNGSTLIFREPQEVFSATQRKNHVKFTKKNFELKIHVTFGEF